LVSCGPQNGSIAFAIVIQDVAGGTLLQLKLTRPFGADHLEGAALPLIGASTPSKIERI
jgi:hypothetical protein